ncbi:hypothetical protein PPTG_21929 [Phytophthora nicotianae INRA-310]|uniref:Uncharacterized protein n=1 Tax=Phytophthora nicotianae (strain INRA-310) TaxID=761204 RepID=W2QS90_PHYN3|nr:hypothetical protein PPTG_21929 [Phytophthora nicotianae INRA-310]ETN15354.1 hypothetical protein PPTG_21929 [Phytophthora nicotianae INRA-310]
MGFSELLPLGLRVVAVEFGRLVSSESFTLVSPVTLPPLDER